MKTNQLILKLFIFVLISCSQILYAQEFKLAMQQRSPKLGEGYDSRKGNFLTNRAFDNINDGQLIDSISSGKFVNEMAITNSQDFEMSGYDVSVSGHYLAFHGRAEVHGLSQFSTSGLDVVWYISYERDYTTPLSLSNPGTSYSVDAKKLLRTGSGKEFISQYGDHYVSSITMGHRVTIRYIYHASSTDEKKEFSALVDLHLKGLLGSGEMSANMSKISQKYNNSTQVKSTFIYQAGDEQKVAPTLEALIQKEFDFDKIKKAVIAYIKGLNSRNASCVSFELSPYPNLPHTFSVPSFDEALAQLFTEKYFEISSQIATLKKYKDIYSDEGYWVDTLDEQIREKHKYLIKFTGSGSDYFNYRTDAEKEKALDKLEKYIDEPLSKLNLPPERVWVLNWDNDMPIRLINESGDQDHADMFRYRKKLKNLLSGDHHLRIMGTITTDNPPSPPPDMIVELVEGPTNSVIYSMTISPSPVDRYHFDETFVYTPSSQNPGYLWLRGIIPYGQIKVLTFQKDVSIVFMK